MDRALQTWELTQRLLADDPELDPACELLRASPAMVWGSADGWCARVFFRTLGIGGVSMAADIQSVVRNAG